MNNLFSSNVFSCDNPVLYLLDDSKQQSIEQIIQDKNFNTDQPFELFRVDYINPLGSKIIKCEKPDQVVIVSGIVFYSNELDGSWDYIFKLYYDYRACPLLFFNNGFNLVLGRRLEGDRYDLMGIEIDTINHILDEYGNPRVEIVCNSRGLEPYEVSAVKGYFKRTKYSSYYDQIRKSQEAEMAFCSNFSGMPIIKDVYYNAPHTTVKWSDGTSTTVSCCKGEEFNKEIGLMAAISRKYFEILGMPYPRAAIKNVIKNAHDQTEKTAARKAYKLAKKQKLLAAAQEEEI